MEQMAHMTGTTAFGCQMRRLHASHPQLDTGDRHNSFEPSTKWTQQQITLYSNFYRASSMVYGVLTALHING